MAPSHRAPRLRAAPSGFTLVEAMVSMAILALVVAGLTTALNGIARTDSARKLNAQAQSEARGLLVRLEDDVREASLGSSTGVIFTVDDAGTVIQRPAVQIFDDVNPDESGGSLADAGIDPKPHTDAILVVGVEHEPVAAVTGRTYFDSNAPFDVSDGTGFSVGDTILAGPYRVAAWGRIQALEPVADAPAEARQVTLVPTTNSVLPNGKLDAGSMVRRARAELYFVNRRDELVRVVVARPRLPQTADDVLGHEVVAVGVENLQLACRVAEGTEIVDCGASVDATLLGEADEPFGGATATLLDVGSISRLRLVDLDLVARSRTPLRGSTAGDEKVAVGNAGQLPVGGGEDGEPYIRRAYQLSIAVRNTSLEML